VTFTSSLPYALDELSDIARDEDRRQVFVDRTGHRRRRLRLAGYAGGVVGLVYVGMIGVSLAGGPVEPGTLLALPSRPLQAVEKAIERVMPGTSIDKQRPAVRVGTTGSSQPAAPGQTTVRQGATSVSADATAPTPSANASTPATQRAPSPAPAQPAPADPAPDPAPVDPAPNPAPVAPAPDPAPVAPAPDPAPGDPPPDPRPVDPAPGPGPADPAPNPAQGGGTGTLPAGSSVPDVAAETAKSATGALGG
jgi:hypothetical protein